MKKTNTMNSRRLLDMGLRSPIAKVLRQTLIMTALLFATTVTAKDLPGAAQTSYGVGSNGVFSFSMPIVIPQGTNGVQPNLSINLSSSGGNGLLGVGGNIGGLGAITRCAKTIATDGIKGRVGHNAGDQFCLNGKRLILVSGTHGQNGAEYRTEIDEISRIKVTGTSNNLYDTVRAPNWWEVRTKDNMIYRYGSTPTSKFYLPGTTSIHQWKLASMRDRSGNFYEVTYHTDDGRPNTIAYTSNNQGLAADKIITFVYGTRPGNDQRKQYVLGKLISHVKRLTSIQVRRNTTKVREYKLAYATRGVSQRSRLASITECGISNVCMPAVKMTWQTDVKGFAAASAADKGPLGFNQRRSQSWCLG